jgi:hypothetical protein
LENTTTTDQKIIRAKVGLLELAIPGPDHFRYHRIADVIG